MRVTLRDIDRLRSVDIGLIDNGSFETALNLMEARIKTGAIEARRTEGDPGAGFEKWKTVHADCEDCRKKFILNSNVPWAKRKTLSKKWRMILASAGTGAVVTKIIDWLV